MSLENRSSLRKLPFPASTQEALRRLYAQCVAFARKQPSPKEIDVVLEVIDEFVFSASAATSSVASNGKVAKQQQQGSGGPLSANPAVQELQMLQVQTDLTTLLQKQHY
jgi:hypothetical protein